MECSASDPPSSKLKKNKSVGILDPKESGPHSLSRGYRSSPITLLMDGQTDKALKQFWDFKGHMGIASLQRQDFVAATAK